LTIPSRGDLVWLDFDPQAGRRPALVLSDTDFNNLTGFAIVCPITNQVTDYAFEIPLPDGLPFSGVILTDQMKSLDVNKRKMKVIGNIPVDSELMRSVLRNTRSILA
jgi:mRNA interferase MazF